jgi:hypothetical protein
MMAANMTAATSEAAFDLESICSQIFDGRVRDDAATLDEHLARVRYHEAGHAVFCIAVGGTFDRISLSASRRSGDVLRPSYTGDEHLAAAALAGCAGEVIMLGACIPQCAQTDVRLAFDIAKARVETRVKDRARRGRRSMYPGARHDDAVAAMRLQATIALGVLVSRRNALVALADALERAAELSFAEARAVVESAEEVRP